MFDALSDFKSTIAQTFSLSLLARAANTQPINLGRHNVTNDRQNQSRMNNLLIKTKQSALTMPDNLDPSIQPWITSCLQTAEKVCADVAQRYVYLTVDNKPNESGQTQRAGGWHIDGLQGDEVSTKAKTCFQFLWVNNTPTEFCPQPFETDHINLSKINVFNALAKQVDNSNNITIKPNHTYLMHCYHVHRATQAEQTGERLFLRLYLSHCPVTSKEATLNPNIEYPFIPHTTEGTIPSHLT
jgi:hypothetical protein